MYNSNRDDFRSDTLRVAGELNMFWGRFTLVLSISDNSSVGKFHICHRYATNCLLMLVCPLSFDMFSQLLSMLKAVATVEGRRPHELLKI